MTESQTDAGLLRRVAWLGLAVILCVTLGASFGTLFAAVLGIERWIGYVVGFGFGYLLSRTLLRRFFSRNL